ncbi:hypothetical protein AVEN_65980-1 [Araneus ventricosus]|uniref:Uncharacterized protein n=1 Tax=Araneus ventricosus TaxID=182803 RepID=A0A4Y2FXW5_ARAVE|nr:hypothetical protein AVEN_65980-1 [Araneus ventricosus]
MSSSLLLFWKTESVSASYTFLLAVRSQYLVDGKGSVPKRSSSPRKATKSRSLQRMFSYEAQILKKLVFSSNNFESMTPIPSAPMRGCLTLDGIFNVHRSYVPG